MAYPAVTYSFTNGTTADATQVNQNFTDLVDGVSNSSYQLAVDGIFVRSGLQVGTAAVQTGETLSVLGAANARFGVKEVGNDAHAQVVAASGEVWFQTKASHPVNIAVKDGLFYFNLSPTTGSLIPGGDKTSDFGSAAKALDDCYADDYNNVADFYHMDDRKNELGQTVAVNDIDAIKAIKPSNNFDARTGLRLIDDNTIPDWMLTRDKSTKEILKDSQDRPYLSNRVMLSLLMGAIRKIDERLAALEATK